MVLNFISDCKMVKLVNIYSAGKDQCFAADFKGMCSVSVGHHHTYQNTKSYHLVYIFQSFDVKVIWIDSCCCLWNDIYIWCIYPCTNTVKRLDMSEYLKGYWLYGESASEVQRLPLLVTEVTRPLSAYMTRCRDMSCWSLVFQFSARHREDRNIKALKRIIDDKLYIHSKDCFTKIIKI